MTSIVSADPRITDLLNGLTTSRSQLAPWLDGQGNLIGGVMVLTLSQPATLTHEWRGISWADSTKTIYSVIVYDAQLSNVTRIDIWVDLRTQSVVGWSPNSDATPITTPAIVTTIVP